jgi:selenocysteine-specific elongation factor
LRSRQRVRIHLGASEGLARVRVLEDSGEIKPGQRGLAQLRFESPIVGVLGDRFIVRSYSPQVTLGGGKILDPFAGKHRARDLPDVRTGLHVLEHGNPAQLVNQFVAHTGKHALSHEDLAARTAWRDEIIDRAIDGAIQDGDTKAVERSLISRQAFEDLSSRIKQEIKVHHAREPLSRGLPKEVVRERFFAGASSDFFRGLINELEKSGIFVAEKEVLRSPQHAVELSAEDKERSNSLEAIFRRAGLAAPALADAFSQAGLNSSPQHGRKILQLLLDAGTLVKVHGDMFFHREAIDSLVQQLRAYASSRADRMIDVAAFKELTGISRKYAIPLLEHLDRQRVTRREGDRRVVL